ncbi:MAG: response regulator transcription factor [bacterium]|nr:response regulator transcription factor [bacterium]
MEDSKARVLIVEDDEDINKILYDMLVVEGYDVKSAYSGTEASIYIEQEEWSLVLLDLMIPGKSGEELLVTIRKENNMPVIIISAKEEPGIQAKLLRIGADDFIRKPFDVDEVLARVEANLRRYQSTTFEKKKESVFVYDNIRVDVEAREVLIGDIVVNLTAKEFSILELFLRYPTKVFSKDNLYESVWGSESICDDNTITVHISNLRSKLVKAGTTKEYIKTIWGIGYRFL